MISGILVFAAVCTARAAVYTFPNSAEYDSNFREILNPGATSFNAGGYISNTNTNLLFTGAFDTDGAGAGTTLYPVTVGTTLSVSADVRFSHAGSFGFFFSAVGGGVTYLTLLNADAGSANDQARIFSGGSLATGAVGTQDLNNSASDTVTLGSYSTLSSTFEVISADSIQISLTTGAQTFSQIYTGVTLPTSVEIGIRTFNPAGSVNPSLDFDNFTVTDPVPEPSVTGLGALGMLALLARRRR